MSLKSSLKSAMSSLISTTKKNSPAILTAVGVTSLIGATVLMVKEVPKANEDLEELHEDLVDEDVTKREVIFEETKVVVKDYAPSIILTVTGVACIIAAYRENARRTAALATALQLSETARRDYIETVKEKLGEKTHEQIQDEVTRKEAEREMPEGPGDNQIHYTNHGDQLYFDSGTGRWFRASNSYLDKVVSDLSDMVFQDGYVGANELAYMLAMPSTTYGNLLGWNSDDLMGVSPRRLDIRWQRCYMSPWGEAYAVLEYEVRERYTEFMT